MKLNEYFRSLSGECHALKDRVRHFINDAHWLTDGEGKESILRNLIGRNLPDTVRIGRGFVVSHEQVSTQIDVLFYDASILFYIEMVTWFSYRLPHAEGSSR